MYQVSISWVKSSTVSWCVLLLRDRGRERGWLCHLSHSSLTNWKIQSKITLILLPILVLTQQFSLLVNHLVTPCNYCTCGTLPLSPKANKIMLIEYIKSRLGRTWEGYKMQFDQMFCLHLVFSSCTVVLAFCSETDLCGSFGEV